MEFGDGYIPLCNRTFEEVVADDILKETFSKWHLDFEEYFMVPIAQSRISPYHFHTHSHTHSDFSSWPLADFPPTCLAQVAELWE